MLFVIDQKYLSQGSPPPPKHHIIGVGASQISATEEDYCVHTDLRAISQLSEKREDGAFRSIPHIDAHALLDFSSVSSP